MYKLKIKDLAWKPTDHQLLQLLEVGDEYKTDKFNAYWNIYNGDIDIKENTLETIGVPIFKHSLKELNDISKEDLFNKFKAATWRRIVRLHDFSVFNDNHDGKVLVHAIIRSWFKVEELDFNLRIKALSVAINHFENDDAVKIIDIYSEDELNSVINVIKDTYNLPLFTKLNALDTKHIITSVFMLDWLRGKKLNQEQTSMVLPFLNNVIRAQADSKLPQRAIDFVAQLTQIAQQITFMVGTDTLFNLADVGISDVQEELDFARTYWLLQEEKV